MSIVSADRSVGKESIFQHNSPHNVSQWVATCKSDDAEELNHHHRRRSVESIVSCASEEPMEAFAAESFGYHYAAAGCPTDLKTQGIFGTSNCHAVTDDWLIPGNTNVTSVSANSVQLDTEMSEWHEKRSGMNSSTNDSNDSWVRSSWQGFQTDDNSWLQLGLISESTKVGVKLPRDTFSWLTGEEKCDEPRQKDDSIVTSKLDRDWLLVKNELHKIAMSNNSEWLIGDAQEDCLVKDNRFGAAVFQD